MRKVRMALLKLLEAAAKDVWFGSEVRLNSPRKEKKIKQSLERKERFSKKPPTTKHRKPTLNLLGLLGESSPSIWSMTTNVTISSQALEAIGVESKEFDFGRDSCCLGKRG